MASNHNKMRLRPAANSLSVPSQILWPMVTKISRWLRLLDFVSLSAEAASYNAQHSIARMLLLLLLLLLRLLLWLLNY